MSDGFFVLIMVLRRLVFPPCFDAVMTVAQCLPVAPVPEELLITTVRNDVIHVRRLNVPSFLHALYAQRVCLKVLLPGPLPSSTVTSARSRPHLLGVQYFVTVTILLS